MKGFRFYFDKSWQYLYDEDLELYDGNKRHAKASADRRLRMYANLFNRDMRKVMLTGDSQCATCGSKDKLQIDHKIPIVSGGKNEVSNLQILCRSCNRQKGGRHG